jgi:hypothetical protein
LWRCRRPLCLVIWWDELSPRYSWKEFISQLVLTPKAVQASEPVRKQYLQGAGNLCGYPFGSSHSYLSTEM